MAFYEINVAILVVLNALAYYKQRQWQKQGLTLGNTGGAPGQESEEGQQAYVARFKRQFFSAYILVVAADWLQARGTLIYDWKVNS